MWRRVKPSTWQELCLAGPGSSVQCWAQDVSPDAWQVCCLFECGLNLALWCMLTGSRTSYVDLQKWILQHFRCHLLMHHCQITSLSITFQRVCLLHLRELWFMCSNVSFSSLLVDRFFVSMPVTPRSRWAGGLVNCLVPQWFASQA